MAFFLFPCITDSSKRVLITSVVYSCSLLEITYGFGKESVAPLAAGIFLRKEGFTLNFEKSPRKNNLVSQTKYQKCFAPRS